MYAALVTGIIAGVFAVSFLEDLARDAGVIEGVPENFSTATSSADSFPRSVYISPGNPKAYSEIVSPFFITGEARGAWFENGGFSIILYDKDHRVVGETSATAVSAIVNEGDFVPFVALLNFGKEDYRSRGSVMFKRGGAPPIDFEPWDYHEVPIYFGKK